MTSPPETRARHRDANDRIGDARRLARASAPTRTRRDALFAAAFVVGAPRARASVETDLREKTFPKTVFTASRPEATRYPGWLEGEWRVRSEFAGYEFPSASASEETIAREPSTRGFKR